MADPKEPASAPEESAPALICKKCRQPLVLAKVTVTYRNGKFPLELPKCPSCGMVYVPESLATGKMLQVEQSLEDK